MKVYWMNWDGKFERMTAARSKKEAVLKLGTTIYQFNTYASETYNEIDVAIAMGNTAAVFEKSYKRGGEWREVISP